MLTLVESVLRRDERPAYRPYTATVKRIEKLTPHFTLVTFSGEHFDAFGTDGLDQRIKIIFPVQGELCDIGANDAQTIDEGSWYTRWRALPEAGRNPFRTYTVRDIRPGSRELDVVFVDHGIGGPAASWLASAREGVDVLIVGPDAHSVNSAIGIDWHPGTATDVLLVGDETAAPAICSILESLPEGIRAHAFIEVPTGADVLPVTSRADVAVSWIARDHAPIGSRLEPMVREWISANPQRIRPALGSSRADLEDVDVDVDLLWDSPDGESSSGFYAWLAGEASVIKTLRRFLVTETGIDRGHVAFMGYWRLGKAEAQ